MYAYASFATIAAHSPTQEQIAKEEREKAAAYTQGMLHALSGAQKCPASVTMVVGGEEITFPGYKSTSALTQAFGKGFRENKISKKRGKK